MAHEIIVKVVLLSDGSFGFLTPVGDIFKIKKVTLSLRRVRNEFPISIYLNYTNHVYYYDGGGLKGVLISEGDYLRLRKT